MGGGRFHRHGVPDAVARLVPDANGETDLREEEVGAMKRLLIPVVAAIAAVSVATASVAASGMITAKDTGGFVLGNVVGYPAGTTFTPSIAPGSTVDTLTVRVPPGGDFGWHYHNAAVVVTVTAGSLTLYDATTCDSQTFAAGTGFVENPGVTHLARNEGSSLAVLIVTYLGIPPNMSPDVNQAASFDPCNGIE